MVAFRGSTEERKPIGVVADLESNCSLLTSLLMSASRLDYIEKAKHQGKGIL
jgi:hypothetical protein